MAITKSHTDVPFDLGLLKIRLSDAVHEAFGKFSDDQGHYYAAATVDLKLSSDLCGEWVANLEGTAFAPVWYWRDRGQMGKLWVGVGSASQVKASGEGRFETLRRGSADIRRRLVTAKDTLVRFFAGFSFENESMRFPWADWPNGWLVLPRFVFCVPVQGQSTVTVTCRVSPGDVADLVVHECIADLLDLFFQVQTHSFATDDFETEGPLLTTSQRAYSSTVSSAIEDIRRGRYEKAVMARQVHVQDPLWHSIPTALHHLDQLYPDNTTFAIRHGESCFLGASPERLCEVNQGRVSVDCLAGTIQRGANPDEDEAFANLLLASQKNLHEHDVVVEGIAQFLEPVVSDIRIDKKHSILRLRNVQHLYSQVNGKLRGDMDLFDVAACLHPTPAVSGYPKQDALNAIAQYESFERGWYAGGMGLLDEEGNGALAVMLRSALVTKSFGSLLYAGAGIMEDSSVASEWDETDLKLHPMLEAFNMANPGGHPDDGQ